MPKPEELQKLLAQYRIATSAEDATDDIDDDYDDDDDDDRSDESTLPQLRGISLR